jgi:hypothetical protein
MLLIKHGVYLTKGIKVYEDWCITNFTRNPELGKVKQDAWKQSATKSVGCLQRFALHTMIETHTINCDKFVFYDAITKNDIWSEEYYQKA